MFQGRVFDRSLSQFGLCQFKNSFPIMKATKTRTTRTRAMGTTAPISIPIPMSKRTWNQQISNRNISTLLFPWKRKSMTLLDQNQSSLVNSYLDSTLGNSNISIHQTLTSTIFIPSTFQQQQQQQQQEQQQKEQPPHPSHFFSLNYSWIPLLYLLWTSHHKSLSCSPSYQGIPMAALFLVKQSEEIFSKAFPTLEMTPVLNMSDPDTTYEETSGNPLLLLLPGNWPTECCLTLPLFMKKSEQEEVDLGQAGVRKPLVGKLIMKGSCKYGCAQVEVSFLRVEKMNGDLVWEWNKS